MTLLIGLELKLEWENASNENYYCTSFVNQGGLATLSQHLRLVNVHRLFVTTKSKLRESRRLMVRSGAGYALKMYIFWISCLHNKRCLGTFAILLVSWSVLGRLVSVA